MATLTAARGRGASERAAEVLTLADDLRPDVHIALGDLSHAEVAPEQAWCTFVDAATGDSFPLAPAGRQPRQRRHIALDHPQSVRALPAPAAPPSIAEEARLLSERYAARSR